MAAKLKRYLTDDFLLRLRPQPARRSEYGDTGCKGLVVRVGSSGRKTFSVIYKVKGDGGVSTTGRLLRGVQHRITLGEYPSVSIEDARAQALQIVSKSDKGDDPRREMLTKNISRSANSFEAVAAKFIELYAKPNTVAWRNIERILINHVVPSLGRKPIDSVTRTDVHNVLDKLIKAEKIGVAREVKKHLCTLFNWAINREICTLNPALNLGRKDLKPNDQAGRSLDDDEIAAIWHGAARMGYPFGPMFQLLLLTGQRKGEWAFAKKSEINTKDGYLEIPSKRYKGRRDHIVPLTEQVQRILSNLPVFSHGDYSLFSTQHGRVSLEKASIFPDPTLSFGVKEFREDDTQAFVAGVSLPIPVFNLNRAGIARAGHELNAVRMDQRSGHLSIDTSLTEVYGNFASAYREASALETSVLPGAEEAFSFARQGYEAGKFGYLDVLDAQRTLFDARRQYNEAVLDYYRQRAAIERITAQHAHNNSSDKE